MCVCFSTVGIGTKLCGLDSSEISPRIKSLHLFRSKDKVDTQGLVLMLPSKALFFVPRFSVIVALDLQEEATEVQKGPKQSCK